MDDAAIFSEVYPGLRRFAAAVSAPDIDPDDLVQEAVARTLRIRPLSELDEPMQYLRRAVLNLARNDARNTGRRRELAHQASRETTTVDVYPSECDDLAKLTVEQRGVL